MRQIALVLLLLATPAQSQEYYGKFDDGPEGRFIEQQDRPAFELAKDFSFEDPNGVRWMTPKGSVVNGASIPQAFWSMIGGPFDGPYLKASVIHDHYCTIKSKTAHDTHRNFYYGMRANGVAYWKAKAMYWAVATFGPSWTIQKKIEQIWRCDLSGDEVSACTSVPKAVDAVVPLPMADLSDPEVLAVALGKFNAIARTLKTTNGESLDVTAAGQIDASLDSIEANAGTFRHVMASGVFRDNPSLLGLVVAPTSIELDQVENWPRNSLPTISDTAKFDVSKPEVEGPVTLAPGDIEAFGDQLDLSPMQFKMPSQ